MNDYQQNQSQRNSWDCEMTNDYRKEKETAIIDAPFTGKFEDIISQLQDWKNEGEWEGIEMWHDEDYGGDVYQLYKYV